MMGDCREEKAQGVVEYALLLAFVVVLSLAVVLAGDGTLKDAVQDTFADIVAKVKLVVGI